MQKKAFHVAFWLIVAGLFIAAMERLISNTPDEQTMGPIQKIFYLHLPVAINTFLACLVAFIASVGYLAQRKTWWDDLAAAAARVSVQLCTIVLLTGMIWGKCAWGQWWTWSPRLTFSLVLWLLYTVYLIIRSSIESSERRALICAVYAIIAFLDVPLVYLSVRLMPDIHPSHIELAPEMKATLGLFFGAVTAFTVGLIATKYSLNRLERGLLKRWENNAQVATVGGFASC